jgi:MraZ protein
VTSFLGRYEYQMDEKGRVALPSAFRREAEGERFVLLQWEKPYLTLFPQSVWGEMQAGLMELRRSGVDAGHYVRELLSMAAEVAPDKQGRILVPGWLQDAASLSGTVLIHGNIDRVELWNPAAYEEAQRADIPDDVSAFAKRILG